MVDMASEFVIFNIKSKGSLKILHEDISDFFLLDLHYLMFNTV